MKLLIDMSLSPSWAEYLRADGHDAQHWSAVGHAAAPDREIMDYARANAFVVFTHDLDFGAILAVNAARGPSVIQIRCEAPTPAAIGDLVRAAVAQYAPYITRGALITIEPDQMRARILPIIPGNR